MSLGFTAAIGAHFIFQEVAGFSPLWFLEENICVYCLLLLIVVHVILSDKILRSYCLNDKNLTFIVSFWHRMRCLIDLREVKGDNHKLIVPVSSSEISLKDIFVFNFDLMISISQVYF